MQIDRSALQRFVDWTKLKVRLHCSEREFYFHEREIWWASLGHNIGSEQNGKNDKFERPVLVFRKFGQYNFWGLPITSRCKENDYHYSFLTEEGIPNCVSLTQIRLMSSKRLLRRVRRLPSKDFENIASRLTELIKNETPFRGNLGAPLLEP